LLCPDQRAGENQVKLQLKFHQALGHLPSFAPSLLGQGTLLITGIGTPLRRNAMTDEVEIRNRNTSGR
jgi:hypothetical protein